MDISWIKFVLVSLAIFRITRLIVFDQITAFIRAPFLMEFEETNNLGEKESYLVPREGGLRGWIGNLISCYWCTGIWTSVAVVFFQWKFPVIMDPIILIFGLAGMAAIIETIVQNLLPD
ncbi:DUF1360 domain-containing protein [Bacillus sp. FJAT-49732]|uniref:DUF1360 domain-containing protein n=1 Tax=Lederbergia citrisecunda TaxID=2833583 RepID=A0A942TJM2_9BACI|nr:DUF1360 domain-containing protein [Lederbergia citrisecunda]MBS4198698.1 DUF1360 domain-containing protein [Lederbergia citrisecunda]